MFSNSYQVFVEVLIRLFFDLDDRKTAYLYSLIES